LAVVWARGRNEMRPWGTAMILVFALLCAAGTSPAECTKANAIDVVQLPDATNELMCLQVGMSTVASLAIQPRSGEYWKFVCAGEEPSSVVARAQHPDGLKRID
jgi:hypothetical protein